MIINVTKNKITIEQGHTANEGEYNIRQCDFVFSEDYTDDLVKIAVFSKDGKTYKMNIANNTCIIPIEVLEKKGVITLGVYAYIVKEENGEEVLEKRFSPAPAKIHMDYGSYVKDAENASAPTPTEMEQIQQLASDINTQINNLDIDAEKEDTTTTITITKKDGGTKTVEILDGEKGDKGDKGEKGDQGIQGIQGEQGVQGIQGVKGDTGAPFTIKKTYASVAEMNADFDNMNIGDYVMIASSVEVEDNAKLYTKGESQWIFITDFSGATGIQGEKGEKGDQGIQGIQGIQGQKGEKGDTGATGNGIATIKKTSTSGLVDTYTITYTDGTTETYTVTNGQDGEVTQAQFDELEQRVEDAENNQLTSNASGTSIDITDSAAYKNRSIGLIGNTIQDGTPTPENPIELKSTGDNGSINEKVQNKNLFNKNDTDIADGYLVNGVPNGNKQYNQKVTGYIPVKVGKTYIQNLVNTNNQYAYYDKNKNYISGTSSSIPSTGLFNPPEGAEYLRTGLFERQLDTLKVEQGSTATPYQAHEEQNISFPLAEGQKLMQGDYLADDGIHHVESETILDGTEAWGKQWGTNSHLFYTTKINNNTKRYSSATANIICQSNKYIATHYDGGNGSIYQLRADDNFPYLVAINDNSSGSAVGNLIIKDNRFTTLEEWKAYLAEQYANGTPVKIQYKLQNEVIDTYTSEQQTAWEQIKKLRTYKNITHISSEDEVPATVEIKYVRDINTIEDRITALENAISNLS